MEENSRFFKIKFRTRKLFSFRILSDVWRKLEKDRYECFSSHFCLVEGGRYTESGKVNDEGEEIYKICIGRVWWAIVHDASGFPRQRRWIRA